MPAPDRPTAYSTHDWPIRLPSNPPRAYHPIPASPLQVTLIHFPMWGGMFTRGNPAKTEEEYYASDYTDKEREQGLHRAILNWVRS